MTIPSRKTAIELLAAPPHSQNPALRRLLDNFFKQRGRSLEKGPPAPAVLWPAEYFGLHRSSLFSQCSAEQRRTILELNGESLLREGYFIEKAGIAYCARMLLSAETTEESQAYALIGADEAVHLAWLGDFLAPTVAAGPPDSFALSLARIVDNAGRDSLIYLLQVVLEGWGLSHYRELAKGCLWPPLRHRLARVVRDEALHHAGGVVLFKPERLTPTERESLVELTAGLLAAVRSGPQRVVANLACVVGGLEGSARERCFAELETESATATKLALLRKLMARPGMEWLLERLTGAGLFKPCSPSQATAWQAS